MNEQILTEHGYKEYFNRILAPEYSSKSFQKLVTNVYGKPLYWINLHYYPATEAWVAQSVFSHHGKPFGEDTQVSVQYVDNLRATELLLHRMWKVCGATPVDEDEE